MRRRLPTVIRRSSQTKEPIEWQADVYSSCLLIPRRRLLLGPLDHAHRPI
jgi:hypothetical protein